MPGAKGIANNADPHTHALTQQRLWNASPAHVNSFSFLTNSFRLRQHAYKKLKYIHAPKLWCNSIETMRSPFLENILSWSVTSTWISIKRIKTNSITAWHRASPSVCWNLNDCFLGFSRKRIVCPIFKAMCLHNIRVVGLCQQDSLSEWLTTQTAKL